MSQSPSSADKNQSTEAYDRGWVQMGHRVLQGRSWSGRERHCAFLNTRGPRFATVSHTAGIDFPEDGRGLTVVDWDHDGDLDLWLSHRTAPRIRFMRNESPVGQHYVAVRLQTQGGNRDAIGARVAVVASRQDGTLESPQIQTLRAGEGFLSQSSKWLHFGLGAANGIARIEVRWPDGKQESFSGMPADRRYLLVQGSGVASAARVRPAVNLKAADLVLPAPATGARTYLAAPVPAPPVRWRDALGSERTLAHVAGKATLVNLWSRWCKACVAEFKELGQRSADLDKAGLRVVALNVDEVAGKGQGGSDANHYAEGLLRGLGHKGEIGNADKDLVTRLEIMHRMLMTHRRDLPLPTSFLLDDKGWLRAIYKGRVSVDTLLADRATLDDSGEKQRAASSTQSGRWYSPLTVAPHGHIGLTMLKRGMKVHAQALYEAAVDANDDDEISHNNLALLLAEKGRNDEAEVHLQRAIKLNANYAEAYTNLGNMRKRSGRLQESLPYYEKALMIAPDHAAIHNSYGIALAELGWLDKASREFAEAVRLKPDYIVARQNLDRARAMIDSGGAPPPP